MTPQEAADTSGPASGTPKSTTRIKITARHNIRRIYATWWDIANTSLFLLVVFACLVALALFLVSETPIDFLGANALTPERRVEIGLSILGLSVSAGSAVALWLLNKGIERWSIISRIYYLHRYIFKALSPENSSTAKDVFSSYASLSDGHFENINVCHPMAQKYFEELRLLVLMDQEKLGADHLHAEVSFRCFMICLMTKGSMKGADLDAGMIAACRQRAQAAHGIETA
jgi:hypothetical protein